jgi:hypothetical protein
MDVGGEKCVLVVTLPMMNSSKIRRQLFTHTVQKTFWDNGYLFQNMSHSVTQGLTARCDRLRYLF